MALGYKQYRRKLWRIRAFLIVVLALCILVAWSVFTRWQVEREMAARRAAAEVEYAALKERYQTLQEEVTYLSDERSLEAEIRKHFDVAKEGESVVIILDNEQPATVEVATSSSAVYPWWQFWR